MFLVITELVNNSLVSLVYVWCLGHTRSRTLCICWPARRLQQQVAPCVWNSELRGMRNDSLFKFILFYFCHIIFLHIISLKSWLECPCNSVCIYMPQCSAALQHVLRQTHILHTAGLRITGKKKHSQTVLIQRLVFWLMSTVYSVSNRNISANLYLS